MALQDAAIPVKFKLFALWCSVIFLYIYGDYFQLFEPGQLTDMIAGKSPFGAISQTVLLGMSAIMIIPGLMPFLCLALPAPLNRWLNIVFGAVYTIIMVLAIRGGWHYYVVYGLIEIVLTALIVYYAWRWPKLTQP